MRVDPESPYHKEFRAYQKKLRQRLRDLREEYGYTQQDLADTGIATRTYERMEQDADSILSIWQLYRIAKFYEIELSELVDV